MKIKALIIGLITIFITAILFRWQNNELLVIAIRFLYIIPLVLASLFYGLQGATITGFAVISLLGPFLLTQIEKYGINGKTMDLFIMLIFLVCFGMVIGKLTDNEHETKQIHDLLYSISHIANSGQNNDKTIQTILNRVAKQINADQALLMLVNNGKFHSKAIVGVPFESSSRIDEYAQELSSRHIATRVLLDGKIFYSNNPQQDRRLKKISFANNDAFVCLPLSKIGVMFFSKKERFNKKEIRLLKIIASEIESSIKNARLNNLVNTDQLTELFSSAYIKRRGEYEIAKAKKLGKFCSLIIADIDHFKFINDTYGHEQGNVILKQFGRLLNKITDTHDIIGRYGGEEFIIILPQKSVKQASVIAETIRQQCENLIVQLNGQLVNFTISLGVSFFPTDGETFSTLIEKADQALYQAKNQGRNKVVIAS